MRDLQIKLLYEQYGWSADQIARLLNESPAVVRMIIDQEGFSQQTGVISQEQAQAGIDALKSVEVAKQQQVTPIMTAIELSLFAKIMELVDQCETQAEVAHLVKAYKSLTQDAIINAVVREEKAGGLGGKPTIAVQIINEVA